MNKYKDIVMPVQHRHLANKSEDMSTCRGQRHIVSPRAQLVFGLRLTQCHHSGCTISGDDITITAKVLVTKLHKCITDTSTDEVNSV